MLAAAALMTEEERAAGERLPLMRQARLMVKAMPCATRVGEFIAMWAVAKYHQGETTIDGVAEYWGEPQRTIYRRMVEFREVWAPAGHDTPDRIADHLIGDYRRRQERMDASKIARLLSAEVPPPFGSIEAAAAK
jgi:hypothetical protein